MLNVPTHPAFELRSMRRARGLSQQRLAELANCSMSMVCQLERGYQPQSGHVLQRVLDVLLDDEAPGDQPDASRASQDRRVGGDDVD